LPGVRPAHAGRGDGGPDSRERGGLPRGGKLSTGSRPWLSTIHRPPAGLSTALIAAGQQGVGASAAISTGAAFTAVVHRLSTARVLRPVPSRVARRRGDTAVPALGGGVPRRPRPPAGSRRAGQAVRRGRTVRRPGRPERGRRWPDRGVAAGP